jgi:hypothetical protein
MVFANERYRAFSISVPLLIMFHSTVCLIISLLPVVCSFALGGIMAPPNILVFLMDDMGIGDSRVYNKNSKVSMPNLEKLAAAGITFTDAHTPAAVCAPTRYSVMTGNYTMAWEKSERHLVI